MADPTASEIADRALATGQVIVVSEGQVEDDKEETASLAGVRSALCAPVFVRGQPAGYFYVDHHSIGGLFGEDEKRLAEFIAVQWVLGSLAFILIGLTLLTVAFAPALRRLD